MDGSELYRACLEAASGIVRQVRVDQLMNSTPDTDWTVRDLVGHMLYEVSWVPDMVAGRTMDDVGSEYDGDLIGDSADDLADRWQLAADRADMAVGEVDLEETAHLSYADVTNDEYLWQAGSDVLIHAWDLGKAIGAPVAFDVELVRAVYDYSESQQEMLRSSGLFGDQIEVEDTADIQTKLLGMYGRKADWRPAS